MRLPFKKRKFRLETRASRGSNIKYPLMRITRAEVENAMGTGRAKDRENSDLTRSCMEAVVSRLL